MEKGIFVGMSTIDILYRVEKAPAPNSKVAARDQAVLIGGPATNAAVTFSHLGGAASLVTTVGRHPLAELVRRDLERFSIHLFDLNADFDEIPALSSIIVSATGDRAIVSTSATRAVTARLEPTLLDGASILLVDGHFMDACILWAEEARKRNIPVVMDGGSWKVQTEQLLNHVDVAICSADFHPPGCETRAQTLEFLQSAGISKIAITDGERPVEYSLDHDSGHVPVPSVTVVDTMGAGDIFHGAFCRFYSQERDFVRALLKAVDVASKSVQHAGTRGWMLSRS